MYQNEQIYTQSKKFFKSKDIFAYQDILDWLDENEEEYNKIYEGSMSCKDCRSMIKDDINVENPFEGFCDANPTEEYKFYNFYKAILVLKKYKNENTKAKSKLKEYESIINDDERIKEWLIENKADYHSFWKNILYHFENIGGKILYHFNVDTEEDTIFFIEKINFEDLVSLSNLFNIFYVENWEIRDNYEITNKPIFKTQENWSSNKLKGKVKCYAYYEYDVIIKDNEIEKGQRQEDWYYKCFFDKNGNQIKVAYYNNDGSTWCERFLIYDERNNIVSNINYSNNSIDTAEIYEYDELGILIKKSSYFGDRIYKYIYEYKKNNIILEHCYISDKYENINNKYDGFEFCKYDNRGNLIEIKKCANEEIILGDDTRVKKGEFFRKYTYEYDDCDNTIKMTNYNPDNTINEQQFYEYNELRDMMRKNRVFETKKEELTIFEYEYDNVGNWIKEIRYDNNIPTAIRERTFEYFEEDCPF
ncbi:MAG: hypothetical protein KGV44_03245 [Flavobacteriaceae bacterium]|nr:hypothetical protein [Flavobacteriaceae bacterium]